MEGKGFTDEFYQIVKEKTIPVIYNVFQKAKEKRETHPRSFYGVSIIILITQISQENHRLMSLIDVKILYKIIADTIQQV